MRAVRMAVASLAVIWSLVTLVGLVAWRLTAVTHASLLRGSCFIACIGAIGTFAMYKKFRWQTRRDRCAAGRCVECGYDLRESVGRCPECGTIIAPLEAEDWGLFHG